MNRPEILPAIAALSPILLGIALLVSQRLISGPRDRLHDDPVNLFLAITGWVLIWVGLFVNFAAIFCMTIMGGFVMAYQGMRRGLPGLARAVSHPARCRYFCVG